MEAENYRETGGRNAAQKIVDRYHTGLHRYGNGSSRVAALLNQPFCRAQPLESGSARRAAGISENSHRDRAKRFRFNFVDQRMNHKRQLAKFDDYLTMAWYRSFKNGGHVSPNSKGEESMSVESTRAAMTKYFQSEHGDVSMMADDVVFTIMATGQEHRGRDGVMSMLNYFYQIAFDATAVTKNVIFADQQTLVEGDFVGKHIGEFAGIPATQKKVRVPIAVAYDLEHDRIKRGRVYFEMPALLQQLKP